MFSCGELYDRVHSGQGNPEDLKKMGNNLKKSGKTWESQGN